ncbi:MAG: lecithin retinol acyltransferase family protein [Gemmataceae bacterium]|nr:lecithin retinol acyltransferase family protein [Gemmataceae bacterium]
MSYSVGTILKRPFAGFMGWFCFHWGVYVADGKVIHFNGVEKKSPKAVIRLDTVDDFREKQHVSIVEKPPDERRGEEIQKRAFQALNDGKKNDFDGKYCFVFNNCQAFCVRCSRNG